MINFEKDFWSSHILDKLASIGICHPWQFPLILPESYDHVSHVQPVINLNNHTDGEHIVVTGLLTNALIDLPNVKGKPSCSGSLTLYDCSSVKFNLFGSRSALHSKWDKFTGKPVSVKGVLKNIYGQSWLSEVVLIDDENKPLSITASYKSIPNIACSETIKKYVDLNLQNIPIAANHIRSILPIRKIDSIINNKKLEQIIYEAHRPTSINKGFEAINTLDRLAALFALEKANSGARLARSMEGKKIESKVPWQVFLKALPFQLTGSQLDAISNIIKELDKPYPMRGMLQGDVGSGKTAVYGLVAAYVAWSGQRVAVLMPNDTLAKQVYEEITGWFPKLNGILVNGKNKIKELNPFQLIVGTTAVLFREHGDFGLVVIDEQQKFSREQRELLLSEGTHLLEVSATPIPRSVALLKHGSTSVWKIKGNHSNKKIVTKVLTQKDMMELIYMVKNHVEAGNQCIIVYPLVNESQAECMEGIMPVVSAYQKWDKMFPGQVVMAHSEMKPDEKAESILKMKKREASILVSTTVIEVGVTIPGVMLLAVVRADRMGLVTLHQLRGRIARQGGVGDFLLCLPQDKVSEKTMRRMNVLVEHEDGFDVAELDLALRGFGDLSSDSNDQSGADKSFLPTRTISYNLVNELMEKFV